MPSRAAKAMASALQLSKTIFGESSLEVSRRNIDRAGLMMSKVKNVLFSEILTEGMPCAWIRSAHNCAPGRAILYIHGGGFYSGTLPYTRLLGSRLAYYTGTDVFSFAYRLAPENPYPAQLEDTIKAYSYLLNAGCHPERIAFLGDSAGGTLALAAPFILREKGLPMPGAIVGMSPWTDITCSFRSFKANVNTDPTTNPDQLPAMAKLYAGGEDLTNPKISPYFGDFTGFPPTLLQTGMRELIVDDVRRTGRKMRECGVRALTHAYAGMWHVFQGYGMPESIRAFKEISWFLKKVL